MPKWTGKTPQGLGINSSQRPTGKWGMLRTEEIRVFPKAEHTKGLSQTKWSALKTYEPVTLYRVSKLYVQAYICIRMLAYVCNNNS